MHVGLLVSLAVVATVESGTGESAGEEVQTPAAEAAQAEEVEEEEEEEERVEPREGEGDWQQISVPVLPPGVLAVGIAYSV